MRKLSFVAVLFAVLFLGSSFAQAQVRHLIQFGEVFGVQRANGSTDPTVPALNLEYAVVTPVVGTLLGGVKVGVGVPNTQSYFSPRLFFAIGHKLGDKFLLVFPVGVQYGPAYFGHHQSLMYGGGGQLSYKLNSQLSLDFAIIVGAVAVRDAPDVDFVGAGKCSFTIYL